MRKARLGLVCLLVFGIGISVVPVGSASLPAEDAVRQPIALSQDLQEVIGSEVASRFEQLLEKSDDQLRNAYAGMYFDENKTLRIGITDGAPLSRYQSLVSDDLVQIAALDTLDLMAEMRREDEAKAAPVYGPSVRPYEAQVREEVLRAGDVVLRDVYQFERQTYSYAYLQSIFDSLTGHLGELGIQSASILPQKNRVKIVVLTAAAQEQTIRYLYSQMPDLDIRAVEFLVCEQPNQLEAKVYSGELAHYKGTGGLINFWHQAGTIGFHARDLKTGQYGIVTNAHVALTDGVTNNRILGNANKDEIGKPAKYQFSGKVDAAFVPYTNQNSWDPTCHIVDETTRILWRIANTSELQASKKVVMYGANSGYSEGQLVSTSTQLFVAGREFTDVFSYDCPHGSGDSGSPVGYVLASDRFHLFGIHFAGEAGGLGYGIKSVNLLPALDIDPITHYRMGDVNRDFRIDTSDAQRVLQYAVDKIPYLPTEEKVLADVNYDGKVDTTDARIILQRDSETYPSEL